MGHPNTTPPKYVTHFGDENLEASPTKNTNQKPARSCQVTVLNLNGARSSSTQQLFSSSEARDKVIRIFARITSGRSRWDESTSPKLLVLLKETESIKTYHVVNVYITMENHHFQWVNPRFLWFLWPFSIANCQSLPPRVTENLPLGRPRQSV